MQDFQPITFKNELTKTKQKNRTFSRMFWSFVMKI